MRMIIFYVLYYISEFRVPVNVELAEIDIEEDEFKIVFILMVSVPIKCCSYTL